MDNIIPLITTFSSGNSHMNKIIKNNFEKINNSNILPNHKLILAYRRNKSLSDILIRAKLPPLLQNEVERWPEYFIKLDFIRNQKDKTIYRIDKIFSPKTKNIVYIIICSKCHKQYIGETMNDITTRMWQHKYNILNKKETDTPLVLHFISHGWASVQVAGLQSNPTWSKTERKWIHLLDTLEPIGLNKKYATVR